VLLDTNAVGSLYEPRQNRSADDLAAVRNLLADRVQNRSVQVVIAYRLLEEYAPVQRSDPARYTATLDYLQGLVGPHLLLPVDQMVAREARARRRLRYDECVFEPATREGLWRISRLRETLDATASELEKFTCESLAQASCARAPSSGGSTPSATAAISQSIRSRRGCSGSPMPTQRPGTARPGLGASLSARRALLRSR